jgi:hypothetical protein
LGDKPPIRVDEGLGGFRGIVNRLGHDDGRERDSAIREALNELADFETYVTYRK